MLAAQTVKQNIWRPLLELPRRRELILSLAKRDLLTRYKGSVLGLVWAVITPVVMIAIFTFIFAGIFGARFGSTSSHWDYALYLFCGLVPWTMFQDTLQQSATSIVNHANLVKRVVFPLETLPVAQACSALGNQLFATIALLLAVIIIQHRLPLTAVWFPVVLLPQLLLTIGAAWLLASLGVFLRDLGQTIGIITTVLLFLSPVFYPSSALPKAYLNWLLLNPLTFFIEEARNVLIWGRTPDWGGWVMAYLTSLAIAWLGFAWFQKTRKGFADVM